MKPGHSYRLPPSVTLAFLAGCYGRASLFADAVVGVPADDLYAVNKIVGDEYPFFTRRCLRAAVSDAAIAALGGEQNENTARQVENAHHLIALYIANEPSFFQKDDFTRTVFDHIMSAASGQIINGWHVGPEAELPGGTNRSEYIGVVAGLCIAGVLRYGEKQDEQVDKRQRRFKLALDLAALAIGSAVFPGAGAVGGAISLAAEPLANSLFQKNGEQFRQEVIKVGGNLEAAIRHTAGAASGIDREKVCNALQETVHRCGYAF